MLNYHVNVTIQDESHAIAETRGHRIKLNVKNGACEAVFKAAETLLTTLGADFDEQVVALDLRNMPTEEAMQKVTAAFEKLSASQA